MGLLPYSILLAKVLWIAAVAAQIFSSRVHSAAGLSISSIREISPVWLIPMVATLSGFRGRGFGFPGLSKMLLFSALLCWSAFMPLILWRIVFVRPVTRRRPCPASLLWFQRLRSSPSDCTVFMAV